MPIVNGHIEFAGHFIRSLSSAAASAVPAVGRSQWALGQTAANLEPLSRCSGWLLKESATGLKIDRRWAVLLDGDELGGGIAEGDSRPPPDSQAEVVARFERAPTCSGCRAEFGVFTRQHHCYGCLWCGAAA